MHLPTDKGIDVTLPVPINSNISYPGNTHHQPIKKMKMYIYRVLLNKESEIYGLFPYNCIPRNSIDEINSRQDLISQTKALPSPSSV